MAGLPFEFFVKYFWTFKGFVEYYHIYDVMGVKIKRKIRQKWQQKTGKGKHSMRCC